MNPSPAGPTCTENTPLSLSTMASASTSTIAVDAAAGSVGAEDARAPLLESGRGGGERPRHSAGAPGVCLQVGFLGTRILLIFAQKQQQRCLHNIVGVLRYCVCIRRK